MVILAPMKENKQHLGFNIWPIHPQPLEDEILSSWMIRLAHANRFKVHDFYKLYFGNDKQIWTRDIDHLAPNWLINGLSAHTGVPIDRVKNMALRSYEGFIFEKYNLTTTIRGILPLGIYHRTRKFYGQQFCPACLAEDKIPYFRKKWRVAYINTCNFHNIFLHDRCPHCQQPIMPHRSDMKEKVYLPHNIDIRFCSICSGSIIECCTKTPSPIELNLQKKIFNSIEHGAITFAQSWLFSFIFLEGLRAILNGFVRAERQLGKLYLNKFELEKSDIHIRTTILKKGSYLLDSWPDKFINYCKIIKQPYSNFVSKNSNGAAPFWICQQIYMV